MTLAVMAAVWTSHHRGEPDSFEIEGRAAGSERVDCADAASFWFIPACNAVSVTK
jgi:hypothetical protein